MLLYRIVIQKFARDLSGRGAQLYGGRWNPKGTAVLYTAETPAQALLEYLPHFPDSCAPDDLMLVTVKTPDELSIEEICFEDLSVNWNAKPPIQETITLGSRWLARGETAALRVPSVMLPFGKAWNMVLNTAHPLNIHLEVIEVVPLPVDPRLAGKPSYSNGMKTRAVICRDRLAESGAFPLYLETNNDYYATV
jgi:RES domain-containing protein